MNISENIFKELMRQISTGMNATEMLLKKETLTNEINRFGSISAAIQLIYDREVVNHPPTHNSELMESVFIETMMNSLTTINFDEYFPINAQGNGMVIDDAYIGKFTMMICDAVYVASGSVNVFVHHMTIANMIAEGVSANATKPN